MSNLKVRLMSDVTVIYLYNQQFKFFNNMKLQIDFNDTNINFKRELK